MAGLLSVVATPIGNLDDLSPRAARTMERADVIACEDTRVTRKLLTRLSSRARLVPYHAHNEQARTAELVRRVAAGEHVALVTDAGMPGVSDPGRRLVAACLEAGLHVEVVPGPSAVLTALVLSGMPAARFAFEGFLPRTATARRRRLRDLAKEERTIVLFESPHRLAAALEDMLAILGDRRAALTRELTKVHEEVVRAPLSELVERVRDGVRGEVTLVIAGAPGRDHDAAALAGVVDALRAHLSEGLSKKDAIARVASELDVPKKAVYQVALDEDL
ncbi:MAG: 16S rRNA (cytidine(1402)-2'-O)-methyltransferase [Actinobacteria bacterium]|nr:MAG: 16S rRNA (cytidine(1402)-2'-O)-methyltransferase [Actinomycetota bacterium]